MNVLTRVVLPTGHRGRILLQLGDGRAWVELDRPLSRRRGSEHVLLAEEDLEPAGPEPRPVVALPACKHRWILDPWGRGRCAICEEPYVRRAPARPWTNEVYP